jgi:molybdate transport system substrate-binding protein
VQGGCGRNPRKGKGQMNKKDNNVTRRFFLKASSITATGSLLMGSEALASNFKNDFLQVWSCGGLAEAFIPANKLYQETIGCRNQ